MSSPPSTPPQAEAKPAHRAALAQALGWHRAGQVARARAAYEGILSTCPDDPEALHLLGLAVHQAGEPDRAAALIGQALRLRPGQAVVHGNLGVVLSALGRHEEALLHCERAIALQPDHPEAHGSRGHALQALGRDLAAIASYDMALLFRPDDPETHYRRGLSLQRLQRFEAAAQAHAQAVALAPRLGDAHFQRGNALRAMGRAAEALASYEAAIAARPDDAESHGNRANLLQEAGQLEAAVAGYDQALAILPGYAGAHHNRGVALRALSRPEEALASLDRALAIDPGNAGAHLERGLALQDLNRADEALASHGRALALRPGDPVATWNQAWVRLLTGDYEHGWAQYEAGWAAGQRGPRREFDRPLWTGQEPLQGRTILLHAEQGLGDTLQFCRYAAPVAALGARVVLEVPAPLVSLMQGLDGVDTVVEAGAALPPFDLHCPLLSLPRAFGTRLDTIPAAGPYLRSDPAPRQRWKQQLGASRGRPRLGLAWSGSTWGRNARRSLTLGEFLPSLPARVEGVCLQKALREIDREVLQAQPNLRFFGESIADFSDTAALCDSVDLVVSVDTSVAHLAAAMGRPTWILLPHAADWRWLLDRSDSPWYPSVRLYRQHAPGDWSQVLARLRADLRAACGGSVP